jgi:hypothetical protein
VKEERKNENIQMNGKLARKESSYKLLKQWRSSTNQYFYT